MIYISVNQKRFLFIVYPLFPDTKYLNSLVNAVYEKRSQDLIKKLNVQASCEDNEIEGIEIESQASCTSVLKLQECSSDIQNIRTYNYKRT